jgi:glycosyltransferase involved in cell wall biosynthesis
MMRPRVLELSTHLTLGGIERLVGNLAVELPRHGVEVDVASYLGEGLIADTLRAAGHEPLKLQGGDGFRPRRILELWRLLRRRRITALHTHHLGPLIYGLPAARLAGVPVVHTEHSLEHLASPRLRFIEGRLLAGCAVVTAVSADVAAEMARLTGFSRSRIQVIENGVPITAAGGRAELARRTSAGEGDQIVAYLGRLSEEKGVDILLRAWAEVKAGGTGGAGASLGERSPPGPRRVHLAIIGDGGAREALAALAAELGLEHVHFLGACGDGAALCGGADLFVLPSRREGLPLALLEALLAGLPVVATAVGGVPALLDGLAGAALVPAEDPARLRQAIEEALRGPSRFERAALEERYGIRKCAAAYADCFRRLMDA